MFDRTRSNDHMIVDNQYPTDVLNQNYAFSQRQMSTKDEDGNILFGRRVYLESPSFGNKEEEDMYRYVSSRLTDRTSSIIDTKLPGNSGAALMDSLDFELEIHGANNSRQTVPVQHETNPIIERRELPNIPRTDPRQDPLLGPLFAELDAMSNQQQRMQPPSATLPVHQRPSIPYETNLIRPVNSSHPNQTLTNIPHRRLNDPLIDARFYDSLEANNQTNVNLPNYPPTQQKMDGTDLFLPPTYSSNPSSFLNNFGPDDHLFQRSTLNNLGQNYIPNPRPQQRDPSIEQQYNRIPPPQQRAPSMEQQYNRVPPPQQRDPLIEQQYNRVPPPQQRDPSMEQQYNRIPPPQQRDPSIEQQYNRIPPPQQRDPSIEQQYNRVPPPQRQQYIPPNNNNIEQQHFSPQNRQNPNQFVEYQRIPPQQNLFFTDRNEESFEQQHQQQPLNSYRSGDPQDPESKRQAVWNELQRNSGKAQEKNGKKRESINRNKGAFGSNTTWNGQQSPPRPSQQVPVSKQNYIEESFDSMKNTENFYPRYPTRKHENSYSNRNEIYPGSGVHKQEQEQKVQPSANPPRQTSLPVTIHLNTNDNSQNGSQPTSMTIPIESQIHRDGDKILVNIDLRLADLQNAKQQNSDSRQSTNLDPIDRHIRKLERNMDQSLPVQNSPQRSPGLSSTGSNHSIQRQRKVPSGGNRVGYNPPVYGGDYYNYADKGPEEDSYLSKLNYSRKQAQFKPYTNRDYQQFKTNFGFGIGNVGTNYDNTTTLKEKSEKMAKTKEYAQQIEARNKKILGDASRRTYSDSRLPADTYKYQRVTD